MSESVALVTAAASGIGRAIAVELASSGWRVIVADIDEVGAQTVEELGRGHVFVQCDIGDPDQVSALMTHVSGQFEQLDTLVNNAGISKPALIGELDRADWDRIMAVNLSGAYQLTQAALPMLRRATAASIVNISSIHAQTVLPGMVAYAASKAGLDAFTRSLAIELGPKGIRANAVLPGFVATRQWTDWLDGYDRERRSRIEAEIAACVPLGRPCAPEEIARVVRFLAGPDASCINGVSLLADGGLSNRSYLLPSAG